MRERKAQPGRRAIVEDANREAVEAGDLGKRPMTRAMISKIFNGPLAEAREERGNMLARDRLLERARKQFRTSVPGLSDHFCTPLHSRRQISNSAAHGAGSRSIASTRTPFHCPRNRISSGKTSGTYLPDICPASRGRIRSRRWRGASAPAGLAQQIDCAQRENCLEIVTALVGTATTYFFR